MAGVESVVTPQPVIKDVQTLKANLKEQEKRARSAEVDEVLSNPVVPPSPAAEQRKRRKVSSANKHVEEPVLDGPLPSKSEEEPSNPVQQPVSSSAEPAPVPDEASDSHVIPSDTPAEVTEPSKPVPDQSAPSTAEKEATCSAPVVVPPSSEAPVGPADSQEGAKSSDDKSGSAVQQPVKDVPNGQETEAVVLNGSHEEVTKSS